VFENRSWSFTTKLSNKLSTYAFGKADIAAELNDVRFGGKADIGKTPRNIRL
jgi:hypothetical protein